MCFGSCDSARVGLVFTAWGPLRSLPLTAERRAMVDAAVRSRADRHAERERRIEEMCANERGQGREPDRAYCTMVYDFEMAPSTNGRTMLLECGIIPFPPQDLPDEQSLHEALWTVVEALASQRVFLLNTDHLGDRQLYERLFYKILDEPTHCLPPDSAGGEFIDVLHSMDVQSGGHGAVLDGMLLRGEHPSGEAQEGVRAPFQAHPICDRDRFLPRAVP